MPECLGQSVMVPALVPALLRWSATLSSPGASLWCQLHAFFHGPPSSPMPPPLPPCNDGQHTCSSPASTLQTDRCFVVPSQCACTNHAKQKLQRCRIVWIDCKIILIIVLYCYIKSCVNCKGISRSRKRVSVINPKLMTASCHF